MYFICLCFKKKPALKTKYKELPSFPGGTVLRICLQVQGTRVRALGREDPTCCGATMPMHHSFRACALEPTSHNY